MSQKGRMHLMTYSKVRRVSGRYGFKRHPEGPRPEPRAESERRDIQEQTVEGVS